MHQSGGGNMVDCCELELINRSLSKRKSRGLLLSLVPHTLIFQIHISRLFRPLTLCQLVKHQQASVSTNTPCREKGQALSWLIVRAIMSLQHPIVPTSPILSINMRVCFPLPLWCVTHCWRFVFNMCDRIHLTGSEKTFFFFSVEQQQPFNIDI